MNLIDTPFTKVVLWFSRSWPWVRLAVKRRSVLELIDADPKAFYVAVDRAAELAPDFCSRTWANPYGVSLR